MEPGIGNAEPGIGNAETGVGNAGNAEEDDAWKQEWVIRNQKYGEAWD